MKIAILIARLLLGLAFLVFGLNGFLHFLPQGPMPSGPAVQFLGVLMATHYAAFIFGVQLVCGVLLLTNCYVPLGLVVLAGVIANILVFHLLMAPSSIGPGVIVSVLWFVVAWSRRAAFSGLLQKAPPAAGPS